MEGVRETFSADRRVSRGQPTHYFRTPDTYRLRAEVTTSSQYLRPLTWDESGAVSVFEVVPATPGRFELQCPLIVRVVLSTLFARQCNAVCESNRYFQCAT